MLRYEFYVKTISFFYYSELKRYERKKSFIGHQQIFIDLQAISGRESFIVDKIGYDKEGHTVYTKLGNDTETTYTYDKQRERLQVMKLTADGQTVMVNRYRYDAVDNILGITNAANPMSLTKLNKAKFTFVLSISVLPECMSFVIRNCNKK